MQAFSRQKIVLFRTFEISMGASGNNLTMLTSPHPAVQSRQCDFWCCCRVVYERSAIEEWMKHHDYSPVDPSKKFTDRELYPAFTMIALNGM